ILLLALAPALWHLGRGMAGGAVHVVCGLAVAVSVLAACTAGALTENGWVAYHVLTAGLVLTGLAALVGGWALERRAHQSGRGFPAQTVQGWVTGLGLLT